MTAVAVEPVRRFYTARDVATILGISNRAVFRLVARGDLAAVRCGPQSLRIAADDLEQFIERRRTAGKAVPQ